MTGNQERDLERDLPVVSLRNAILDAQEAHKRGSVFTPDFIEQCRDQLTAIYEDLIREKAA